MTDPKGPVYSEKGGINRVVLVPRSSILSSQTQSSKLRHCLAGLLLISAAATLSGLLPTPWSLIHASSSQNVVLQSSDPASEWKDNVWPLRPPTPWDISTDYSYPRKASYNVREGTWLRLDVHPTTGDIIFDMVGDIYCLPGEHVKQASLDQPVVARPVINGVPYDSDPHFSPNGDRIVFRSDAELGVENIWVTEWKGCEAMDLRPMRATSAALSAALRNQEYEERLLVDGVREDKQRRYNRLLREGRLAAQRVTNETYRWVSDARFHPSGSKVVATKWYTSERSLGAGEGWEYSVPSLDVLENGSKPVVAGSGNRIISRTLPLGWTSNNYGDQQIGPEQFVWKGNDAIIYSKNVIDNNRFDYSKDVHKGIYAIFQQNLTTGSTKLLVNSQPGGASRPELSRDGRTLAFVRRIRDKQALVLKDLHTGSIHNVWYGLTYDLTTVSAPMGTYPSFAFSPDDSAVIIWAAGQIYSVPLSVNSRGERTCSSRQAPRPIPFLARIEKRLAETRRGGVDVLALETQDTQPVRAFKELRVDSTGRKVVFQAAGVTYWHDTLSKKTEAVPVTELSAPYYSPSFVFGDEHLIIHARWSDSAYSNFEVADLHNDRAYSLVGLPLGRYFSPVLCECYGARRTIAFLKTGGSYLSGDILATGDPGLYLADIVLPTSQSSNAKTIEVQNIRFIPTEIDPQDLVNLQFLDKNKILLVQQSDQAFTIDLTSKPDISGKYHHDTLASGKMSKEIVIAPISRKPGLYGAKNVAFVDTFDVYVAPGYQIKQNESVWSKPGNATKGLVRVSLDGGHDITWSRDGRYLFWLLGPYLHHLEVAQLSKCYNEIKRDNLTFGLSCVKRLVRYGKIDIEHTTDISRLKKEAAEVFSAQGGIDTFPSIADTVVIVNATILTMETGSQDKDLIHDGMLIVKGGVIKWVGKLNLGFIPMPGVTVINARGGFVIPGFIDVHAHWEGFADRFPAKSWEMSTFLAYGVTTLHNPSADNVNGFVERSRVERGHMIGPRIFTVGDVIYGAGSPDIHQDISDMNEAVSALTRIKAEGGTASISYKNYNIPSRASRQRLLTVAQNMSLLCVPEGGMNWDWDLTYILDGMTTVEHALPVPTLFEDVQTLYAVSGTGATPTHLVNYGGAWGEQLVWATHDLPNDPKLRRFTRHDILEALTESTSRPKNSFALYNTSASIASMVHKGLLANIGAHGEPPLGLNYHAEMEFFAAGGLTNYEVLKAATSSGAQTLGMFSSLGSLSRGKLADFLVYPPDVDLLSGDLSTQTLQLQFVARGGRIWEADTMVEYWPVKGRKQEMPVVNAE
ncbi:hypothetical protein CPB83DRAFT_848536 [Crepidotus variabilis]|uniref:Amidohydrolase-related domain-containing protein n=1 Tax=Crepidotus variabilis TaxID=179855 RepID=A0A9P6JTC4_9AGAR|nr:hypothetical protein CPB83DRAFT_848536 [Crepidotus variabilis]